MAFEVQEVVMNRFRPGRFRPGLVVALVALGSSFLFAPDTARAEAGSLPFGIHWRTVPWAPCGTTDVAIRFSLCECQVDLLGAEVLPAGGIVLHLRAEPNLECVRCIPDSVTVALGTLAPGRHGRMVRFDVQYVGVPPDSSWVEPGHEEVIDFPVQPTCPPENSVPYLERVIVENPPPCEGCPSRVCPGDSIDVFLAGKFPDDCTWLRGIELVPSAAMGPLPGPPTIRIDYEQNSCIDRACIEVPRAWTAHVRLPELPYRDEFPYVLPVEGWLRDACSTEVPHLLGRTSALFSVAAACSSQADPCFNVRWGPDPNLADPRPGLPLGCSATYGAAKPATLTFQVGAAGRAIAGVQGRLVLDEGASGALSIGEIVPVLPGWQVARTAHPDGGVRFIAFAGPGAEPIPGTRSGAPSPVIEVTVNPSRVDLPARARLIATELLVSDDSGSGIPGCPQIALTPAIVDGPQVAILCRTPTRCDANRDGTSDVRDLVGMILCLDPPANVRLVCADSSVVDCDRDADFDLDDVFCCARHMLGGTSDHEGDAAFRDAPEVALRFGVPRSAGDGGLEVPLSLDALAGVAAGRFTLAYPDERYLVDGVSIDGAAASWWTAHELTPGRIGVALIDLAGADGSAANPGGAGTMTIRLRLRGGATAGGELSVATHEFAGAFGSKLVTPNAEPRVELGSVGRVALSPARPNPFGGTTSLALTLPVGGPAEVAVFDAAGRRVATLLREADAAAGTYMLAWNGADDSGGMVAGGVYFVRVVSGTGNLSRKLLYLPGGMR